VFRRPFGRCAVQARAPGAREEAVWMYVDQDADVVAEVAAVVGKRRTDRAARVTRAVGSGAGIRVAADQPAAEGVARRCRRCLRACGLSIN